MEIRIDTEKDSKDDIRKVIEVLQHVVGKPTNAETPSGGLFSLFNDDKPSQPETAGSPMRMFDSIPDSVTSTQSSSAQDLIDTNVVEFDKDDDELEEVRELKDKSETKSEDLRIIAYK